MAFHTPHQNSKDTSFTFKWIVENFPFSSQKEGHVLLSPAFIVDTMERTKWHLEICPRKTIESEACIDLFLRREEDSKGSTNFKVAFELSLLAPDGSVLKSNKACEHLFLNNSAWGLDNFVEMKSVFAQRPRKLLTVQCRMWKIGNYRIHGHCIARTHIVVERKIFHWKIQNFSLLDSGQVVPLTLHSTCNDKKIISLLFCFLPNLNSDDIYIKFHNPNQSLVSSTFKVSLLNAQNQLIDCGTHEILFPLATQNSEFKLQFTKNKLMANESLYLPNDVLTFYCELAFSSGVVYEGIEETCDEGSGSSITKDIKTANIKCSDNPDLKMDLSSMLKNGTLCDVKLCVESQTFQAHWFVLIARSPVFRAMYESDMKEKIKSQIHISDLRPETFRRMLHYLYTDELEELDWETASELFTAADKYLILPLKDKCSSFLKNNLDCENACEVLLLSDSLQDKELKAAVKKFIMQNDKTIFKSSEWKHFMEANLDLALEIMLLRYEE